MTAGYSNRRRKARFAGRTHRAREEARKRVAEMAHSRPERPVGTGPLCPESPDHGPLSSWNVGSLYDAYCGADDHAGFRFYQTAALAEVES